MKNKKVLHVINYWANSTYIFPAVDIKGGVAVTYWDKKQKYKPIQVFSAFPELNSINDKVQAKDFSSLSSIITNRGVYKYSDKVYVEQPEEMKKTADRRIAPSAFERMPTLFLEAKPNDSFEYVQILGNIKSQRVYRWFRKDYIQNTKNLNVYKVMVPKANGSGAIGECLSTPLIGAPLIGYSETYISIGETTSMAEAQAILKYIKTKFARALLGILKVTQNNPKEVWQYVPMQNFTKKSDIDWTKTVDEIDGQLYEKYGLDQQEIEFIEKNIQPME